MKVWKYIEKKLEQEKLHFTLIDPAEQSPGEALFLAGFTASLGTDAIMVGGTYAVKKEKLDLTVKEISEIVKIPVILFPSSRAYISKYAQAILFLSLLNSEDPRYIVGEPAKGTVIIKEYQLEPISVGYLIVEPGMRVGKRGKAKLIRRNNISEAVEYALFAECIGMKCLYLEAGSGSPQPVPNEMIKAVKKEINIPLIVGGGIVNAKIAEEKVKAGADIIVTGNIIEKDTASLKGIISAVKKTI